jgi:tyrosyl-tRNA synthetase
MLVKKELGECLVDMYNQARSGKQAREEFERVFSQKELPADIPELTVAKLKELGIEPNAIGIVALMAKTGLAKSNSDARNLIDGGGVYLNGERVSDTAFSFALTAETILKVGKRRFLRLLP